MDLLFEAPWWLYAVPAAVGLVLALTGARRGDKTLRNVGAALAVLGVAVYVVSRVVETDQETVTRRSRELVAVVEREDWAALPGFLHPQARLTIVGFGVQYDSRDEIVTAAKTKVGAVGLSSLTVPRIDPRKEGQLITTEVEVYVNANASAGRPMPTTWNFVWTRSTDNQWVVQDLEAIRIGMATGGDAAPQFPPVRK